MHDTSCLGSPIGSFDSSMKVKVQVNFIYLFDASSIYFDKVFETVEFNGLTDMNMTGSSKILTSQTVTTRINQEGELRMFSTS
jgi:hypothetical protein